MFTGILSEHLAQTASHYDGCRPRKTGELVVSGRLGPVEFGKAQMSCDAIENLLAMCGGIRVLLSRLERPEVAGEGVGEWEEAAG